jgi:hypothetical protein
MRHAPFLTLGILIAMVLGIGLHSGTRAKVADAFDGEPEAGDPVQVFVLGGAGGVAAVRRAVDRERTLLATHEVLVLVEGRVFAAGLDAVGPALAEVGLDDRPLEIWTAEALASRPTPDPRVRSGGEPIVEGGATLAELASRETLNPLEAAALLRALEWQ